MFLECFVSVSEKEVSNIFQMFFWEVLRIFQDCSKNFFGIFCGLLVITAT